MIYSLSCSFTGHRKLPSEEYGNLKKQLCETCENLIVSNGVNYFYCGGALGFDTLAANVILSLKEKYSEISLILVLPCKDQADKWNYDSKREYEYILSYADDVIYTSEFYDDRCMQKRNKYLVDNSLYLITYLRKDMSGTKATRNYAVKQNSIIIDL